VKLLNLLIDPFLPSSVGIVAILSQVASHFLQEVLMFNVINYRLWRQITSIALNWDEVRLHKNTIMFNAGARRCQLHPRKTSLKRNNSSYVQCTQYKDAKPCTPCLYRVTKFRVMFYSLNMRHLSFIRLCFQIYYSLITNLATTKIAWNEPVTIRARRCTGASWVPKVSEEIILARFVKAQIVPNAEACVVALGKFLLAQEGTRAPDVNVPISMRYSYVKKYPAPEFPSNSTAARQMNPTKANIMATDETSPRCWYLSESQHQDTSAKAPTRFVLTA